MIRIRIPAGVWFAAGALAMWLATSSDPSDVVMRVIERYGWILY